MQSRWRANAMYEDSSSDEDGPAGCSLYSVLPKGGRPHYKAALRAFRRAHNRSSYISHLRRRGVAVLDPQTSMNRSTSALSLKPVRSRAAEAEQHGGPAGASAESAAAWVAERPPASSSGQEAGEEDAVDDAEGLDGVVRLPFAMASEGAVEALGWLARAVEAGECSLETHPRPAANISLAQDLPFMAAELLRILFHAYRQWWRRVMALPLI